MSRIKVTLKIAFKITDMFFKKDIKKSIWLLERETDYFVLPKQKLFIATISMLLFTSFLIDPF